MKPFFSIVIPALNEEHYIGTLLLAIKRQTFTDFETILVDAESKDKTIEVTNKFSKDFPLKITSTSHKNISGSRNVGAGIASGDYIFFIDSDNSILPDFLEEIKKSIDEKSHEMLIPAVTPDSKKSIYKILYGSINGLVLIFKNLNVAFSTGGNLIIKKDTFNKLHGFDETIFVGEDHDIVRRAKKKKVKIAFLPHTKIIFSVRRLEKEKFSLIMKYFVSTIYIAFFGKITRKIYNYPMGGDYFEKK